jgi:pSer/pThr/pTyr-binding forkhead associated (FHA) protein
MRRRGIALRLVVVEGKGKGAQLRVEQRQGFSIGRSPQADLALDDPAVGDVHVRVYREAAGWLCFDMTQAGFLHNGRRTQRAPLAVGDTLQVGQHVLRLLADEEPAPEVPTATTTPPPAGGACLLARKGNDAGKTFPLGAKPTMILGRGVSTDITIWDIRASRAHCRIDCQQGRYTLVDLSSSNGTYLNERRLQGSAPLKAGDQIRIGSTVLEFQAA